MQQSQYVVLYLDANGDEQYEVVTAFSYAQAHSYVVANGICTSEQILDIACSVAKAYGYY